MTRQATPRFELDESAFHTFLRHHNGDIINTASITQNFYDTPDNFFRAKRQAVRLRSTSASGFVEQWDFRVKDHSGKPREDSIRQCAQCAILSADSASKILENPSVILSSGFSVELPPSVQEKFAGLPDPSLRLVARFLVRRRYVAVSDILLKADEICVEQGPPSRFIVTVVANDADQGRERIGRLFANLKLKYQISATSAFAVAIEGSR